MASLEPRTSSTGTRYRVKWREAGAWQSGTFSSNRRDAALRFLRDFEQHDNHWPDGWIKGSGTAATCTSRSRPTRPC